MNSSGDLHPGGSDDFMVLVCVVASDHMHTQGTYELLLFHTDHVHTAKSLFSTHVTLVNEARFMDNNYLNDSIM